MLEVLRNEFRPVLDAIRTEGGRAFFVGGVVRDFLLQQSSKDVDLEVYGIEFEPLAKLLGNYGRVDVVGKSFGVIKFRNSNVQADISLPRKESKEGQGHKGFMVSTDPWMSPEEAVLRRDFTINAIMVDSHTGLIYDYVHGLSDLGEGVLRHVGPQFGDDPLRVLRGMQLAARFNLILNTQNIDAIFPTYTGSTADIMRNLSSEFSTISRDRLWEEWRKFTLGDYPEAGMRVLLESGWMEHFPALWNMWYTPQDPRWHPEGYVGWHSVLATQEAVRIAKRDEITEDRPILLLATLLHDVGKAGEGTQYHDDGHITSKGHAERGGPIAQEFLHQIGAPGKVIQQIIPLVERHMDHVGMGDPTPRKLNRLAQRLSPVSIEMWERLLEADASGRLLGNHRPGLPHLECWQGMTKSFVGGKFIPLLMGRDLIKLGVEPGWNMGVILEAAKEAQLNGEITTKEEALEYARTHLSIV